MWATSGYSPNPYGSLVYTFGGSLLQIPSGAFDATWSQGPQFNGPVTGIYMSLTVGGLLPGDTFTLPDSFGLDVSVPASSPVPDAASSLLLLGMGLVGLAAFGRWRA